MDSNVNLLNIINQLDARVRPRFEDRVTQLTHREQQLANSLFEALQRLIESEPNNSTHSNSDQPNRDLTHNSGEHSNHEPQANHEHSTINSSDFPETPELSEGKEDSVDNSIDDTIDDTRTKPIHKSKGTSEVNECQNGEITDEKEESERNHDYNTRSGHSSRIDLIEEKCELKKTKLSSSSSSLSSLQLSEDDCDDSDDSDYGKRKITKTKTQNMRPLDKLKNDQRISLNASVNLIKLDDNLIEKSVNNASDVIRNLVDMEKLVFDSLLSSGHLCRKKVVVKEKKVDADSDTNEDSDEEIERLCRIPTLSTEKRKKLNSDSDSSASETKPINKDSKSNKINKSAKKLKTNNDTENSESSDDDVSSNILNKTRKSNIGENKTHKVVDVLDSDISSDEDNAKNERAKTLRSRISKEETKDKSENDNKKEEKEVSKIDKVLRKANALLKDEKKESHSVIDVNSDSDEEILVKKKSRKRLDSDSSFKSEAKDSESNSSDIESCSGDPTSPDSDDSDIESDSKGKKSKKKGKHSKSKKGKSSKTKGRKRIVLNDSSDDDIKVLSGDEEDSPTKSRKKIRKIVTDKNLKQQTKEAAVAERERRERIAEKQRLYNQLNKTRSTKSTVVKELVLEFDKTTEEVLVEVDHTLVSFLKPHQVDGIKFMYDCIIETTEQLENNEGSGCILAHSMGLGKTLQVITFLHTILSHDIIKKRIKTALVICPVNTIKNWANEFKIWLNDNDLENIIVFEMTDAKSLYQRADLLKLWRKRGGVMIIGLSLFSIMIQGGRGKKPQKSVRDAFETCLLTPGPDVVVCDEGHLLKNEKTAYNQAVSKIRTLRRVVLTGTPLQNNLREYYVMVNFVKPNLLGTIREFTNRFVNPITNGQHEDSTDFDVKIMKKRVHILHKLLDGCVHRCDYNVLTPYLQSKFEYVLSIKLSDTQINLYRHYIEKVIDRTRLSLLADYGVLRLVWNHPMLLFKMHRRKLDRIDSKSGDSEDSMASFINDESEEETPSSSESDDDNKASASKPPPKRMRTRYGQKNDDEEKNGTEEKDELNKDDETKNEFDGVWFNQFMTLNEAQKIELSGKFIILFSILEECEKLGDKLLLFTQSLDTLDLLEDLLKMKAEEARSKTIEIDLTTEQNDLTNTWVKNRDYFRIDGSTGTDYRKAWIDIFNDESNYRARLFLLSTKAGGLGINLVGANRCIIFDASWNPTHDVQAIFRIYRFGQKKPVYIYRFLAQGTMEEKIYDRQIIKQSLACRVVDEQQIQRHFKAQDLSEMYAFDPDRRTNRPTPILPKDRLLAELLIRHKDFIVTYHEHDSLLESKPEEDLTEDERQTAWKEYEDEKDEVFLREQQEAALQRQRELFLQQQQQQAQYQQQQQQQQHAQFQQQFPNININAAQFANIYGANLNAAQIYANLVNAQLRQQQQQRQQQQHLQQQQQQQQAKKQTGLPGYNVMTVENIANYLKEMNKSIDDKTLLERVKHIITNGITTCQKEHDQIQSSNANDVTTQTKLIKVQSELKNLYNQKSRFEQMIAAASHRAATQTNNTRQHSNPTVIEDLNDFIAPTNSKPTSVLIEEVD